MFVIIKVIESVKYESNILYVSMWAKGINIQTNNDRYNR